MTLAFCYYGDLVAAGTSSVGFDQDQGFFHWKDNMFRPFFVVLIGLFLSGCALKFTDPKLSAKVTGPCRATVDSNNDGKADTVTSYGYDKAGRLVEKSYENAGDGKLDAITKISYDAKGAIVLQEMVDGASGNKVGQISFHYDDGGLLVETVTDDPYDGQPDAQTIYKYDAGGSKVREIYYQKDEIPNGTLSIGYDRAGQPVSFQSDTNSDGEIDWIRTASYDEQGNREREILQNVTGEITQIVTYAYDSLGNRIGKSVDGGADGVIERETTYFVDEYGNTFGEKELLLQGELIEEARTYYDYSCW